MVGGDQMNDSVQNVGEFAVVQYNNQNPEEIRIVFCVVLAFKRKNEGIVSKYKIILSFHQDGTPPQKKQAAIALVDVTTVDEHFEPVLRNFSIIPANGFVPGLQTTPCFINKV
ncbi:hypothetical protein AXF42_Ash020252 [Apostasia shenzhenica]|uniref:Uncharacterized protein n=1 Tax=Apostasia shenzhenica TaxID=1088818 RepID=A0A2I0AVT6_9ASPA|nr:hypothetical protein AXF42_Ash020252 [Apostasia shenzhenica]